MNTEIKSPTSPREQQDAGLTLSGTCSDKHLIHQSQAPAEAKDELAG